MYSKVQLANESQGIFTLLLYKADEVIGDITIYPHPKDDKGGQLHLEIKSHWRKKWLTKQLAKEMLTKLVQTAKNYGLLIIYSTALAEVSPKMLKFFGFTEYYLKEPKTYYYLNVRG